MLGKAVVASMLLSPIYINIICTAILFISGFRLAESERKPEIQQPLLQHEVAVTIKLVQVFVTDRKGKPVVDLTKDDFSILDGGQPVSITEFEIHGSPLQAQVGVSPSSTTKQEMAIPLLSRKFFLFLDFAYNSQKGADKAVQAAQHFVKTVARPGDEVALLSSNFFGGVTIHEYLTTDHRKVEEALQTLSAMEIAGRADEIEALYWGQAHDETRAPELELLRKESRTQAEIYIRRLTDVAKGLRLVPGNKTVLLFSTGIPASLIYGFSSKGAPDVGNPRLSLSMKGASDVGDPRLRRHYEDLAKEFAASDCVFFVFDTREAPKNAPGFAESFDAPGSGGMFQDDRTTGLDSLKRLSDRTGGRFYSNLNRAEDNLAQVEELTQAYYVLGYPIRSIRDGRFHEIQVETKRQGCRVRAAAGYFNPKPYREFTKLEKDLQLYDLALNERTPLDAPKTFSLEAYPYPQGFSPKTEILASLDETTQASLAGDSVEFIALAFDGTGNLVDFQKTAGPLPGRTKGGTLLACGLAAKAGPLRCRVVIRNLDTGASAVSSVQADAPKPGPWRVRLLTPLLSSPLAVSKAIAWGRSDEPGRIRWQDLYPYEGLGHAPLLRRAVSEDEPLTIIVPYSVEGLTGPEINLSVSAIESGTGRERPVRLTPLQNFRRGFMETQILGLALDGLPAGEYSLRVRAEDKNGNSTDERRLPLTIKGGASSV